MLIVPEANTEEDRQAHTGLGEVLAHMWPQLCASLNMISMPFLSHLQCPRAVRDSVWNSSKELGNPGGIKDRKLNLRPGIP